MFFAGLFLLIASMFVVSASGTIMKLSSIGNAHAQIGNLTPVMGCVGSAKLCGEFGSSSLCSAQGGCEWTGTPISSCKSSICDSKTGETTCENAGCTWKKWMNTYYCAGIVSTACNTYTTQSPCSAQQGCSWRTNIYLISIDYSDVFGINYLETPNRPAYPACNSTNMIIKLSNITNAHAEGPAGTNYGANGPICYGDLTCQIKSTGNCEDITEGQYRCVVTLSSTTATGGYSNSHLAKCGVTGSYPTKVCCKSAQTQSSNFCELLTIKEGTQEACWNNSRGINCTWTPQINATTKNLTTSTTDGGHCCGEGYAWNPVQGDCRQTEGTCNSPWRVDNQETGRTKTPTSLSYYNKYCAQIAHGGGSIGLYYPVEAY